MFRKTELQLKGIKNKLLKAVKAQKMSKGKDDIQKNLYFYRNIPWYTS